MMRQMVYHDIYLPVQPWLLLFNERMTHLLFFSRSKALGLIRRLFNLKILLLVCCWVLSKDNFWWSHMGGHTVSVMVLFSYHIAHLSFFPDYMPPASLSLLFPVFAASLVLA